MDRVVPLEQEPVAGKGSLSEEEVDTKGDLESLPSLSEGVGAGINRTVRPRLGPGHVVPRLVEGPYRDAHPVRKIVGTPHGDAELVP